jgi:PAS domain S-box-containing protein
MPNPLLKSRRSALSEPARTALFHRQLAETLPHMAWSVRPDGTTDFLNARVYEYTGRNHRQLVNWGWRAVVHPDDWEYYIAQRAKAFRKGQPYEIEYRLRRRDGKYLWHLGAAVPLREGGRIVRWFGTSTDIEKQKRAERLLEKARETLGSVVGARAEELETIERRAAELERLHLQERFRSFLDCMPAIAWIKDSQLRYVWVSASYTRTHGKTLQEVQGREDFELWPAQLARQFRSDDEKALRANGPVQSIDTAPYADGGAARWMVVKFPMPDSEGALGVAGIGFDLTARERDEAGAGGQEPLFPLERLSSRERQVLRLIVDGRTSAEVAKSLGLSPKSVDTYRSRLMAKLNIEDLPALVKFAIRHGLTTET